MTEEIRSAFQNPSREFTPYPFWFWNDALSEEEIKRQIQDFDEKGVNGFVIHPRIGIPKEIEYLSPVFLKYVTCAVEEARKRNMKVILYDEAMYPSGSAHGIVVKSNQELASKALQMTEYQAGAGVHICLEERRADRIVSVQAVQKDEKHRVIPESIHRVKLDQRTIDFVPEDFSGDWSLLIFEEVFTQGHIRGIHFGEDDGEGDAPASSDLLNREAVERFIELTHERYYQSLQEYFGNTIIAFFTDEPMIMGRGDMKGLHPWTDGFLEYYISKGSREEDLPLLWLDAGEKSLEVRRKYEQTVQQRMEETFYRPLSVWCKNHQIALTGHPEKSDDIGFMKYFQIPAQDLVWRWVAPEDGLSLNGQNSTMAKCTSDSARHRGILRNGNECFACCGKDQIEWAFTAEDMKWYLDWLFVRGVNLLYPHAFFYSIDGPKRIGERPPDVGPNNVWWPFYYKVSDYIKRMCYLLTGSRNLAEVAVLCDAHHLPWQIVKPLYENQVEFNYLENELLVSEECRIENGCICIAGYQYKVLLVEDGWLLSNRNETKLKSFMKHGGTVILLQTNESRSSETETGVVSEAESRGAESCEKALYEISRTECESTESMFCKLRELRIVRDAYEIPVLLQQILTIDFAVETASKELRVSHLRKGSLDFYLLFNEGEEAINTKAYLHTAGGLEIWDALCGKMKVVDVLRKTEDGTMEINLRLGAREARIYCIDSQHTPKISLDMDTIQKDKTAQVISLARGEWQMGKSLNSMQPVNCLIPWNEIPGYEHYSGMMTYRTTFQLDKSTNRDKVKLSLGEVHEIARVNVNGKTADVCLWSPYLYDISEELRDGENTIAIEVWNTRANQICNVSITSGLLGPVELILS